MKQLKSAALVLLGSVLSAGAALAQNANSLNVVTTAVPFLRISPDARAGGMGDIGLATSPDANSTFFNLAKTPFATENAAIAATYTPWLKDLGLNDVYLASLAGYYKLDEEQALSLGVRYFSLGNIQFTDFGGNPLNTYRPREFSFEAGYSRKLSEKLGLGVTLKYINSSLANGSVGGNSYKAGNTVAGDISVYYNGQDENGEGWSFGGALSNLGGKIAYTTDANNKDYIPANFGLGVAYTKVIDETNKITFGVDLNKLLVPAAPTPSTNPDLTAAQAEDSANLVEYRSNGVLSSWFKSFNDGGNNLQEITAGIGAEYSYNDQFMVRAGYFYEHQNQGNRKYFTVGAGLKYNVFGLNFSYLVPSGNGVNRNPLSNTLRFSLLFNLDNQNSASTTSN